MKLSVIIPCFNEVERIGWVISAVEAVEIEKEIIIVDDGSTDGTTEVVEKYGRDKQIVAHISKSNFGKGAAIRTGLEYVTGDIVVMRERKADCRGLRMLGYADGHVESKQQ